MLLYNEFVTVIIILLNMCIAIIKKASECPSGFNFETDLCSGEFPLNEHIMITLTDENYICVNIDDLLITLVILVMTL